MSQAPSKRRQPSRTEQDRLLRVQEGRCFYCGRHFWDSVWKNGKRKVIRLRWDHFIPFSFTQANPKQLFVAACGICNGIKRDLIFETPEDARVYVNERWRKKGYTDEEMPEVRQGNRQAEA